jgi:hypothetical protein
VRSAGPTSSQRDPIRLEQQMPRLAVVGVGVRTRILLWTKSQACAPDHLADGQNIPSLFRHKCKPRQNKPGDLASR